MSLIGDLVNNIDNFLWTYILMSLLCFCGIYFSIKTNFVQFRFLKQTFALLVEKPSQNKSFSSFQAFAISTATRVGTGNIAGVAVAISLGGPGAVLWMWILAILGAASSFAETVIGQVYKKKSANGFVGGPAYYIQLALNHKILSIIMAIMIVITFGLAFPAVASNTISYAFEGAFHISKETTAIFLFFLTALTIFKGRETTGRIVSKFLPIIAFLYIGIVIWVIATNLDKIAPVFYSIFSQGLGLKPFIGGTIGTTIIQGIRRGLFSNEAGMGSAPNVSSIADSSHPVKQGIIQIFSVFIDTLVICTCTALLILIAQQYATPLSGEGIVLVENSLAILLGQWSIYFIALCIFLFAYSTILGDCFYADINLQFLGCHKTFIHIFRFMIVVAVALGAIETLEFVINVGDLMMGIMTLINIYTILRLRKVVNMSLKDYIKQRKEKKDPLFQAQNVDLSLHSDHCWK